jgi:hypothetical protein
MTKDLSLNRLELIFSPPAAIERIRRGLACVGPPTMRFSQAFRVFFRILRDEAYAERIRGLDAPEPAPALKEPTTPTRSEALTLISVLQREGRLIDFVQEPIEAYSDAQVGAAAREVHRSCRQALERIFAFAPAMRAAEGETVRVEKGYDPARIRLTGQVVGEPPYSGVLVHPGWEATRCDLPEWTGRPESARVVAPAEVEIGQAGTAAPTAS